jgi:hypothetical protein
MVPERRGGERLQQDEVMVMSLWEGVKSFYLFGGAVPWCLVLGSGKGERRKSCTKSRRRLAKAKL